MNEQFLNTDYYENRELSWIRFDIRILEEARDRQVLLFERLKFLSITASNLDEFFMVRVASIRDMMRAGIKKKDAAGMNAKEQLEAISKEIHEFSLLQQSTFNRSLVPALEQEGLKIVNNIGNLPQEDRDYLDSYYQNQVYPVLTPMAVDSSRPFPLVRNKTLNLAALIRRKDDAGSEPEFATVQVPSVLPRFVEIPGEPRKIVFLEDIIRDHIDSLFLNYQVIATGAYRIMRNADFTLDEEETDDLMKEIQKKLKKRQWGDAIRLEYEDKMDERLLKILKKELDLKDDEIYPIDGPLDYTFCMKLYGLAGFDHLKVPGYTPQPVPEIDPELSIFDNIRRGDIFLHHPYETFQPVVDLIRQASVDPNVLAIKQTLYRVSGNSPIIAALAVAAENGKQVSVLVELKARFDEEHNIAWAKMLEKAGCHVIYGLRGLKTHSKITLVVRREDDEIRRYVHLGTGNYNDSTAKLYTDTGIMTCSPAIGEDATAVFNMLSGYSEPRTWNRLALAPLWLRNKFYFLIDREIAVAKEGRPAHIIAKMNSLSDQGIIAKLYEASAAGVQIDLIVRGICCLRVGIPGVSENIRVRSIVGNYLEHARIFWFLNDGVEEIYMASADWMPRNLDKRVEIMFPVEDPELQEKAKHILDVQLSDTMKARVMQADGSYARVDRRGKELIEAQQQFCREALEAVKKAEEGPDRVFVPMTHISE